MTNPSPIPTQVEVESVDTPELRRLVLSIRDAKHALAISARTEMLIAHIESIITARVAAAEAKGSDNLRQSIDRMLRDTINAGDEPLSLAQMIWTIRERLAASQAAPAKAEGWISCDDRLPSTACLANGDTPVVLVCWKREALADNLSQVDTSNTVYFAHNKDKFTHWMPLPNPPAAPSTLPTEPKS